MSRKLIVVDVQNDFIRGTLAVPHAEAIIPVINQVIAKFATVGDKVIYTKDYHKEKHPSFKEQGGLWPPHCVEGTDGHTLWPYLVYPTSKYDVVTKGYQVEQYSADLSAHIDMLDDVVVVGLATDYCVAATARHCLLERRAKTVAVVHNGTAAVRDQVATLAALDREGIHIVSASDIQ